MKQFLADDFLLNNNSAQRLYDCCKNDPIYDYHSHLSAQEIYENKRFTSISEAWLTFDHYKWRLMRAVGIDEEYITGSANDLDKFKAYAKALEYAVGNPLFHWSHLELKRLFNIDDILSEDTAESIFAKANKIIKSGELDVQKILAKVNVKMIGTTNDICDDLKYHQLIKEDKALNILVLPTFRPDRFIQISDEYLSNIKDLEKVCKQRINNLADFEKALLTRLDYFEKIGCNISDHGISEFKYLANNKETTTELFLKLLANKTLSFSEKKTIESYLLEFLFKEYKKRNWVAQLHLGAIRNLNEALFKGYGADAGADSISTSNYLSDLANFLNQLSRSNNITKTILYNLNPSDNYPLAALANSFQDSSVKGLVQFGSAWWFNDQKEGMKNHLKVLSSQGSLRTFIGMLTDSRSFLSFVRHEYFRRILANYLGTLVENGEYPANFTQLEAIMHEICYKNNISYFNYEGGE
ncbi:MAG: glucuronate isomerase [Erysipelotrichaceae bacterium]